jgi:hypothetical protein
MFFNQGQDNFGSIDLVEFLLGVSGSRFLDVHVRLRIFFPNTFDFDEGLFDLQLVPCIVAKVVNENLILLELKFEHTLQVEFLGLLIELFLDFEADVVPMAGADRLVTQLLSKGQHFSVQDELVLQEVKNGPDSDFLSHTHELVVVVNNTLLNFIEVRLIE